MSSNPMMTLERLTDAFILLAKSLRRLTSTPTQGFARSIIALFDIFKAVELEISQIIDRWQVFSASEKKNQPYEREQIIRHIGIRLMQFHETCSNYLSWVFKYRGMLVYLEVLEHQSPAILEAIAILDSTILEELNKYEQWKLFAVVEGDTTSADAHIEDIQQVLNHLVDISIQVQKAKELISSYAKENLTIDDFF